MSHDVSAYRFFGISLEHGSTIHLSYDLVCNDNSYTKLNGKVTTLQPLSLYHQRLGKCTSANIYIHVYVFLAKALHTHSTYDSPPRGIIVNGLPFQESNPVHWTSILLHHAY